MSSFRVSFSSTRDDIRFLVLGSIGFAVPLSCSFRLSGIPLLSANKSSISDRLVSILFLHQSPHRQVLSISLQSAISLQLPLSSSPIPQRLYSPAWSPFFYMQLQSIDWLTWSCSRRHAVSLPCTYPSVTSVLFHLSLSSGTIVHSCLFSQHVFSLEFSLNCLTQFLQLINIESADVRCVGCNRYNLHVYYLDEIGITEFGVCYHFYPLWYFFLLSFKHLFRSDTISLFNSKEFIDFIFIWVHGIHSFVQQLNLLTFFSTLWVSWYTFRSLTNRLCVLFTIRLPGSPILYTRLCWSSIHTGTLLIQNPTME